LHHGEDGAAGAARRPGVGGCRGRLRGPVQCGARSCANGVSQSHREGPDFLGDGRAMLPRLGIQTLAVVLAIRAPAFGCKRSKMSHPLAPTLADLDAVYRTHDPNLAGHQQAEGAIVGDDGITVLCSANPKGEAEHTWLIHLADDGKVVWERHYAPSVGVG